ncbi:ABC transporter permease [Luedemannella helvata]|uniref:Transport permease protein n=1 Tax=Luedemannella helvata TaxID=349315 RepID=A0ABN2KQQ3_9ACTN
MTSNIVAVWQSRSVLGLLVRRDLTVKYQQSVLGYLWSLLEPLAVAATYWFVFGYLYNTRGALDGAPYLVFLASGLFAWQWTSAVLGEATTALTAQSRLITTIKVPRQVFPIGRVFGKFFEYLAALPVVFLVAGIYAILGDYHFTWHILILPFAIAVQGVFLIGIALLLSSANVLLRDVERFIRLLNRILFYSAPIIYPLAMVEKAGMPGWVMAIYQANPLVGITQLHHSAFLPQEFPNATLLATTLTECVIIFLVGWFFFRRVEPAVLKEL